MRESVLSKKQILPASQHGFRKHRSIDTVLAIITETIVKVIADKKTMLCSPMRHPKSFR